MKNCYVHGCSEKVKARGLCNKHYQRLMSKGDVNLLTRAPIGSSLRLRLDFYSKPEGDCIVWTGSRSKSGYGRLQYKGKTMAAHRLSYECHFGEIPEGMQILHKCDNPSCIRPGHLSLGTILDNMNDRNNKGRCNPVKGDQSNFSKLSGHDVIEIRKLSSEGAGLKELADRYSVTPQLIWMIKTMKIWKHI